MKLAWKKAGIIAGHLIGIVIITCCVLCDQNKIEEKNGNIQIVRGEKLVSISAEKPEATKVPVPTEEPELTEAPVPTEEPELTEAPVPTEEPELTEAPVPTEEPELTEAPVPTEEPELTEAPVPTEEPKATETPVLTKGPELTEVPILTEVLSVESTLDRDAVKQQVLENISSGTYKELENTKKNWWFRRKKEHVPSGSGEAFDISQYRGYYLNQEVEDGDKVIYMTIDCGYGSAHAPLMMDIFKKHNIKVMFFVTKFFIDSNPQYVRRMVEEGHLVGNHSVSHADLTKLSDEEVYQEIIGCEEAFFNVTGKQMDLYFRPPEGAYSQRTMQITEDLGYKTLFWSIAYGDYDKKNQPGKAYVVDHFTTYHHNGAIPLMHNDSTSNLEAMDDVLTLLEEQGYRFGTLNELK